MESIRFENPNAFERFEEWRRTGLPEDHALCGIEVHEHGVTIWHAYDDSGYRYEATEHPPLPPKEPGRMANPYGHKKVGAQSFG